VDEAHELLEFLPLSYKFPDERDYIAFLWDAFETNVEHGKYQFAFLAYHLLTMSFVYFNIWQIKRARPEVFAMGLIGFAREESELLKAATPFAFSKVNERTALRFLRIIECDNGKIGTYAKLVEARNKSAHPIGQIHIRDASALEDRVDEVLRVVREIQKHSEPIIEDCYRDFLLQNHDPEDREYPDPADQIREVLVHENYLSLQDITVCRNFDLSRMEPALPLISIEELHKALCEEYADAY
jgi:hypothetical protein